MTLASFSMLSPHVLNLQRKPSADNVNSLRIAYLLHLQFTLDKPRSHYVRRGIRLCDLLQLSV